MYRLKFSKSSKNRPRRPSSPSRTTNISSFDDTLTLKSEPPSPSPVHDQDILLVDYHDRQDYEEMEQCLSTEIGCPIKLLISKEVHSKFKDDQKYWQSISILFR